MYWVVPRRWDAWLTTRLFGLDNETPVTDEQLKMFTSLLADGPAPQPEEPGFFRQLRPGQRAIISSGPEGRAISGIRATLDHLLEGTVTDERDHVINRMLRRAILERIRRSWRSCRVSSLTWRSGGRCGWAGRSSRAERLLGGPGAGRGRPAAGA